MELNTLKLGGTFEILPTIFRDDRGSFSEVYSKTEFKNAGLPTEWVMDNEAWSKQRFTLRGLHFQSPPFAQAKLLRVVRGSILDVFVDIRMSSDTYGQWDSVELSAERGSALYVPRGFAHGYCTLSDDVVVQYKVDNHYSPKDERGIKWNDPELNVAWPMNEPILSEKDNQLPPLADLGSPFK